MHPPTVYRYIQNLQRAYLETLYREFITIISLLILRVYMRFMHRRSARNSRPLQKTTRKPRVSKTAPPPRPRPKVPTPVQEKPIEYAPIEFIEPSVPEQTPLLFTAVMVEPRKHPKLYYVIHQYIQHLPKNIPFVLFHGKSSQAWIRGLFQELIESGKLRLHRLALDNFTFDQYNAFLKSRNFYSVIHTPKILVFQTDSLVNPKSVHNLDHFKSFDYIGGESYGLNGLHGNGGVSIRDRALSIEAVRRFGSKHPLNYPEDVFFYTNIRLLRGRVGNRAEMARFCCNYCYINPFSSHPMFFHKYVKKSSARFTYTYQICRLCKTKDWTNLDEIQSKHRIQ